VTTRHIPHPPVLAVRWRAAATLAATTLVGLAAFLWPFLAQPGSGLAHSADAPWLFVLLIALLAALVVAELSSGGLDAKTVAVLGVLAAAGGALRVLGGGTAGLEPMFFLLVVAGRVLGRGMGFVLGALAVLVGAFLTGGVGPWAPFQMVAAGWVGFGAGSLPRAGGRPERVMLAGYGLVAGLLYGLLMNLWFWPFLASGAPAGTAFVPGDPVAANLARYAAFYLATSLGWDLPRGVLTAVLVMVAGRPVLASLRRGTRRAAFGATGQFLAGQGSFSDRPAVDGSRRDECHHARHLETTRHTEKP
jgi:energy-coupling factor transport system substrate-specific component